MVLTQKRPPRGGRVTLWESCVGIAEQRWMPCSSHLWILRRSGSLGVLLDVAFEVDFGAFGQEALAAFLAATAKAVATGFSAHAGAETVLAFASALGRLEGAFHGGRDWWLRVSRWTGGQTRDFWPLVNPAFSGNRNFLKKNSFEGRMMLDKCRKWLLSIHRQLLVLRAMTSGLSLLPLRICLNLFIWCRS